MSPGGSVVAALPPPLTPTTAVTAWRLDLFALVALTAVAGLYLWGVLRVRRRHPARPWPAARTGAFLSALGVVALALCSSVGVYQDTLFWVHMIQHLMLIMVAPVLLVAGRPLILLLHASRNPVHTAVKRALRSRPVTVLTCPLVAVPLYAGAVVGTHLTGAMNVVITSPAAQTGEHLLYLVTGYLYFLPGFGREPIRWRLSHASKMLLVILVMPIDTFTGVVLLMTRQEPWHAYLDQHRHWGPSPLTDVHWGGAVMWIGGDAIMVVLILVALFLWLFSPNRTAGGGIRWIEQARSATFAQHTADPVGAAAATRGEAHLRSADIDEDEQRLDAYNAWLARLAQQDPRRR